jgi:hypothetical protein
MRRHMSKTRRKTTGGDAMGTKRNLALCALLALALFLPASTFGVARPGEAVRTQQFDLVPGWNAIYLQVDVGSTCGGTKEAIACSSNDDCPSADCRSVTPTSVLAGIPLRAVWTRASLTGGSEFILDPSEGLQNQPGWLVYIPETRDEAFLTSLFALPANRAYLVNLEGSAPVTLSVTGRPVTPAIRWEANAFTLTGFPVDPDNPPTFADFFDSAPAHAGQPVYRLLADGHWQRITAPNAEQINEGEAYWVYATGGSDFVSPLRVKAPSSRGLDFGTQITQELLEFQNLSDHAVNIHVSEVTDPDDLPLSCGRIDTTSPQGEGLGLMEWPNLDAVWLPADAGAPQSLIVAVRRSELLTPLASMVEVKDGFGTRWLLATEAAPATSGAAPAQDRRRGTTATGGGGASSPFAGLWLGSATIDKVSEVRVDPNSPVSTRGRAGTCAGGVNGGGSCASDADCPGTCGDPNSISLGKVCLAGANVGMDCTADGDCPGSTCIPQGKACNGGMCLSGTNAGDACQADSDCPGSTCYGRLGACEKNQCPGSACVRAKECNGGANAGAPCEAHTCVDSECVLVLRCEGGNRVDQSCSPAGTSPDCPGSLCVQAPRCAGGPLTGLECTISSDNECPNGRCQETSTSHCLGDPNQSCDRHDCPGAECVPAGACAAGNAAGRTCVEDADCPGSMCNTGLRCTGGLNGGAQCTAGADCPFSCLTGSEGSDLTLRLLIHVDSGGTAHLLKQVTLMSRVNGDESEPVLVTDDELIPSLRGIALRDGVPVGKRFSAPAFAFAGNELLLQDGPFGVPGQTLKGEIVLDRELPTNPFRHKFHPDHDNRDALGRFGVCENNRDRACLVDDCPDGDCLAARNRCLDVAGSLMDPNSTVECQHDCPLSTCEDSYKCNRGQNAGASCNPADPNASCPGADCVQEGTCTGGSNRDQGCILDDCPNSRCVVQLACDQGSRNGQSCTQTNFCGTGTCDAVTGLCVDGNNAGKACECPGGDCVDASYCANDPNSACTGHDCPSSTCDFGGLAKRCASGVNRAKLCVNNDCPDGTCEEVGTCSNDVNKLCRQDDCPGSSCLRVEEAYAIRRDIRLEFLADDPTPGRSGADADPDWGANAVGGTYRETISGLHQKPIEVQGIFRLQRASTADTLNEE